MAPQTTKDAGLLPPPLVPPSMSMPVSSSLITINHDMRLRDPTCTASEVGRTRMRLVLLEQILRHIPDSTDRLRHVGPIYCYPQSIFCGILFRPPQNAPPGTLPTVQGTCTGPNQTADPHLCIVYSKAASPNPHSPWAM